MTKEYKSGNFHISISNFKFENGNLSFDININIKYWFIKISKKFHCEFSINSDETAQILDVKLKEKV